MSKKETINDIALKLNKKISEMQLKNGVDVDLVKQEEERLSKKLEDGSFMKNTLSSGQPVGSFLAKKICTGDAFLDMTCNTSYFLGEAFASGFQGNDMPETALLPVVDKKIRLSSIPDPSTHTGDACDAPSVKKDAKIVCVEQAVLAGSCPVHYNMFAGGVDRETIIINLIESVLATGFDNSFEYDIINGDKNNTATNINGQTGAIAYTTQDGAPDYLNHDGLRKHALIGYNKPAANGKSCTWTDYTATEKENTIYDFNESLTIQQLFDFFGKLNCCNSETLVILDCVTWSKIEALAISIGQPYEALKNLDTFRQKDQVYKFLGRTWYVTDAVTKTLPTGITSATATDNTHHYMLAVNTLAVARGFGTTKRSGTIDRALCEYLYTMGMYGYGICTSPEKVNVVAGVNIK